MSSQSEVNTGSRHIHGVRNTAALVTAIALLACVAFAVIVVASAHHGSAHASAPANRGAVHTTAVTPRKSYGMVP